MKQEVPWFTGRCHASSSLSGGLHCCSVRNRCLLIIWLELKSPDPTFTFQVRYTHTQSKVQQFSLLNHQHTSAQPLLLQSFCSDNWTLFSLPGSLNLSSILSFHVWFFFPLLTDSFEQLLNVTVLYVKATHTHLPCCLFAANRKLDGFLVRQNLHFNQASGQSDFCQLD